MIFNIGVAGIRPYPAVLNGGTAIGNSVTFRSGSYTADVHVYKNTNGTPNYQRLYYNPSTFPTGSLLRVSWPHDPGPVGNYQPQAFNPIIYGDYAVTVPNTPITASQVNNITALSFTFNHAYDSTSANHNNYDCIIDYFFYDGSNTSTANILLEVEIALHTPDTFANFADFRPSVPTALSPYPATISGISWNCSYGAAAGGHGPDILCYPVGRVDITSGTIDMLAFHDFFAANAGSITPWSGSNWFTGIAVGMEPYTDTGYIEFQRQSWTYATGGTKNLIISPTFLGDWRWTATNVTVSNTGQSNMSLMETTATGNHNVEQQITVANTTHTYRFQADVTDPATSGLTNGFVSLKLFNSGYTQVGYAYWNLTTHALGGSFVSASPFTSIAATNITALGGGVYRCQVDIVSDGTSTTCHARVCIEAAADTESYTGVAGHGLQVTNVQVTQIA